MALISPKVPTIRCDLAMALATRRFFSPASDFSSSRKGFCPATSSLPRAYSSSCASELSSSGEPAWNTGSAKLRFLV